MLQKYSVLFDGIDLGPMARPKHNIETGETRHVHQAPYRVVPHERRVISEEIERMLELKVIQPSHSPCSSLAVLVPKKDGSTRFCIHYRRLNNLSLRD